MPTNTITEERILTRNVDVNTGTVLSEWEQKVNQVQYRSEEPEYVKLYIDTISSFYGLPAGTADVLAMLLPMMSYAEDGQMVRLTAYDKRIIEEKYGITRQTLARKLKALEEKQILRKVATNIWQVNPMICGKGKWTDIVKLRATFDFIQGTVELDKLTEYDLHSAS